MQERPNILIFMPDQMIADVMRQNHPCITPNMDAFAQKGVRFQQTFCTAPHCCPSRASFFTGEYPSKHGVWNNVSNRCAISRDLNDSVKTLGEILKKAGYNLGFSGKWHVSDFRNPEDFGWEEFLVTAGKGNWQKSRIQLYDNMYRKKTPEPTGPGVLHRPGWGNRQMYKTIPSISEDTLGDYRSIQHGIRAIESLSQRDAPWCIFVSCNAPHDTYDVPRKYVEMYDGMDIPLPESFADSLDDKPRIYQRMRRQYWNQMSEDETKECIKHYWALCTMVDDWFGQLLNALERTGQAENTLALFTSDHGDYAGAHGLWCKGVPAFREAYVIPAIMRWPSGIVNPGRSVEELISIADFMPTFVELATGEASDVYGDSLLPFLQDQTPENWRNAIYTQMNGVELFYTQRIVQTKRWKYVYNGFDFDELYDLENDPHEMVNLANPELYDQSIKERDGKYVPWPRLTPELESVREELYALMWKFARQQNDHFLYTPYLTTAQASYGPLLGIENKADTSQL